MRALENDTSSLGEEVEQSVALRVKVPEREEEVVGERERLLVAVAQEDRVRELVTVTVSEREGIEV